MTMRHDSIAEMWRRFADAIMLPTDGQRVRDWMEASYYAGAIAALLIVSRARDSDNGEAAAVIEKLQAELREFDKRRARRRSGDGAGIARPDGGGHDGGGGE